MDPSSTDSTRRFSDRVENYVRYRPGYPPGVIEIPRRETGLAPGDVVAGQAFHWFDPRAGRVARELRRGGRSPVRDPHRTIAMKHPTPLALLLAAALLGAGACAGKDDATNGSEAADSVAPGMVTGTTGAPGPGTVGTPGTPAAPNPDTIGAGTPTADTTVADTAPSR